MRYFIICITLICLVGMTADGYAGDTRGRTQRGNLVYYDSQNYKSILDVIGKNVAKTLIDFGNVTVADTVAGGGGADTTAVVFGDILKQLAVSAGTGNSTLDVIDSGYVAINPALNDNDGLSLQMRGSQYVFDTTNDYHLYFGARICTPDSVKQSDWVVGLCITDQSLVAGMSDGVYFKMQDGTTGDSLWVVSEKNSTEEKTKYSTVLSGADWYTLEFYFDGTAIEFFIDGTSIARHATTIPNDEPLTVSFEYLNGAVVVEPAYGLKLDWARVFLIK